MVDIFIALVFYTKIVNNKGEGDWKRSVLPLTGGILAFIVTVECETCV